MYTTHIGFALAANGGVTARVSCRQVQGEPLVLIYIYIYIYTYT